MPFSFVSLVVLAVAFLAAAPDAAAMGFGSVRSATFLGQPLNLAVPVRLEDDESLAPECVRAEVLAGDEAIPADAIRIRITSGSEPGERLIRVTTVASIQEPVVTVNLSAGCPPRISRRFVAFADPPEFRTAQAAPAAAPVVQPPTTAPVPTPAAAPEPERAAPAPQVSAPRTAQAEPSQRSAPAAQRPRAQAPASTPRRAARPPAESGGSVAAAPAPRPAPAPAAPPPAQSRLKLDVVEPMPSPAGAERVAAAEAQASAAREQAVAAEAAASAAQARVQQLEGELKRLRAEAQSSREALAQVRGRSPAGGTDGRYLPWLIALLGVLILLAIALGWRLLSLSRAPVRGAGGGAGSMERWYGPSEVDSVHGEVPKPAAAEPRPVPASPTLPAAAVSAPAPLNESRGVAGGVMAGAAAAARPREVTVEEQIDLEQQADFFIALGQDDAAIDLLLTHLRGTGGTSPMPYLKLLDIYRRRDDRDAYERTAARFNQRFNGVAPAWDADPAGGRSLEDHPALLSRLQRLWRTPLDAMADLESMLFRKGEAAELFELPAYLDVLFLYQIARDLHQHGQEAGDPAAAPQVDVLLPIGNGADDPLAVRPVDLTQTTTLRGPAPDRVEPISLDLDLSAEEPTRRPAPDFSDITLRDFAPPPPSDPNKG